MAAQLANLDERQQKLIERPDTCYNVGWSRGRERLRGGDPDWNKGSFYANPLCDDPSSLSNGAGLQKRETVNSQSTIASGSSRLRRPHCSSARVVDKALAVPNSLAQNWVLWPDPEPTTCDPDCSCQRMSNHRAVILEVNGQAG